MNPDYCRTTGFTTKKQCHLTVEFNESKQSFVFDSLELTQEFVKTYEKATCSTGVRYTLQVF